MLYLYDMMMAEITIFFFAVQHLYAFPVLFFSFVKKTSSNKFTVDP